MIILTIRTDKPESEISLFENTELKNEIIWQAHRELAETLHLRLKELLKNETLDFKDLQGIVANEGPGSFTGLRIGLSVANALSYSLEIPIVGETGDKWKEKGIGRILKAEDQHQVMPEYGAPVHTTPQKK